MSPKSSPIRGRSKQRTGQPLPFFVFIAYGEISAARDAIARVKQLVARGPREVVLQPMLWRFDQLGQARWRDMALHDAARAHTIVLAMGNAPALDAGTDGWLRALTTRHAGAPIHCLALLRGDEAWTISLQRAESARPAVLARPDAASTARALARSAQAA